VQKRVERDREAEPEQRIEDQARITRYVVLFARGVIYRDREVGADGLDVDLRSFQHERAQQTHERNPAHYVWPALHVRDGCLIRRWTEDLLALTVDHLLPCLASLRDDILDVRVLVLLEACDQFIERQQGLGSAVQLAERQCLGVER
jgi:hypothetical protein